MGIQRIPDDAANATLALLSKCVAEGNLTSMSPDAVRKAHEVAAHLCHIVDEIIQGNTLVARSAELLDPVVLGPNVIVGPNCIVGPFAHLRKCVVCFAEIRLGTCVEVDSAVLYEHAKIAHSGFVGSGTVGERANLGYGVVFAGRRLDGQTVRVSLGGEFWDTKKRHHGAIIGASAQLGVNVSLMPGATVPPSMQVAPNTTVKAIFSGS